MVSQKEFDDAMTDLAEAEWENKQLRGFFLSMQLRSDEMDDLPRWYRAIVDAALERK